MPIFMVATLLPVLVGLASAAASTITTHEITGPYQPTPVAVEVITPDTLAPGRLYPVLYVLPVAPGTSSRWGSGIQEMARAGIANQYNVICVAPAFSATPWFADHPNDPALQQESHFIKTVLPWVASHLPAQQERSGRFLLGFSKSGYGAIMLLLRHPDLFERAVAWDAPIDKTRPDQFRMLDVFGAEENFAQYAIPTLVAARAKELAAEVEPRLVLMPNRDGDHAMNGVHEQLVKLGIPHIFEPTDHLQHHWESGWAPRAAALVLMGKDAEPAEAR